MVIKAYPRTHYEEFRRYGYRIMHFEKVITHLTDYHYHDYYELSVVLSCRNVNYVCDQTEYELREGDVVFCNVFDPHCYKAVGTDAHCERFNLGIEFIRLAQFSAKGVNVASVFQSYNSSYPIMHLDFSRLLKYYELVSIYKKNGLRHGEELLHSGLVQVLLAYIYEDTYEYLEKNIKNQENIQAVATVIEYVQQHLDEKITLSRLAKEANYSVSYICAAFRSVMNQTINHYIKEKRMDLAVEYLKTGLPITEAAEKAGFNNYSYFYKAFKSIYGITPSEFRNGNLKGEE
ncbi:MAG: AraC family transcriptional regulator [Eubacteriales bacterium]|nr:AraC family transcriptional regulator [Eubacteriales bacterium]